MKYGAIIIENRLSDFDMDQVMSYHKPYLPSDWPVMIIKHHDIKSMKDYNAILTSEDFWEALPFDKVLIFQHDSGLLRTGIEEFLQYDYVGAPWKWQDHGGNGGLSLRGRDAMLAVIKAHPWRGGMIDGNEDVYFSNRMAYMGLALAPRSVCLKFSVETIFQLGTLGYHAMNKYLTPHQVTKILSQYGK